MLRVAALLLTVVRRLCSDHRYQPLSDLYARTELRGPVGTPTTLGDRDDFHPSDRGHREIARRVRRAL